MLFFLLILLIAVVAATSGGGGGGGGGESAKKDEPRAAAPATPAAEDKKKAEEKKVKPEPEPEKKPEPEPAKTYEVGQTATAANVEWKVTDAFLTNQLKSNFGTQKRGTFVVVDFTFTNNRNEEVTLDPELHMILKDSQGREFGSDPDAWEFVPPGQMIFLEPVNPGVSTNGRVVYEVAPDATGFTLKLDDVEFMEEESVVFDLGNISQRAYDSSSASASAY